MVAYVVPVTIACFEIYAIYHSQSASLIDKWPVIMRASLNNWRQFWVGC